MFSNNEDINWEKIRKKVDKAAEAAEEKLRKGKLVSQQEAAIIRERDLYNKMERIRKDKKVIQSKSENNIRIKESKDNIKTKDDKFVDNQSDFSQEEILSVLSKNEKDENEITDKEKEESVTSNKKLDKDKSKNFDINNYEQQIELIKEGKIYYAETLGREKNLEQAFSRFEKDNQDLLANYEGKEILLKVNLVDPDHPQGCTDVETVRKIISFVKKYNPKKIFIGDIPSAMGKKNRNWSELKKIYEEKLKYKFGEDVELINLEKLESKILEEGGNEFKVKNLDRFGGVINIAKPKMHGEFGYTGCAKNLMGFLEQESRSDVIHMKKDGSYNNKIAHQRLNKFASAIIKYRPDIINVLDGYDFVIGHEHFGLTRKTDFAMVSRDPFNTDSEVCNIIGLNKEKLAYLNGQDFPLQEGKMVGNVTLKNLYNSSLEDKLFLYKGEEGGKVSVVHVIDDSNFLDNIEVKRRTVNALLDSLFFAYSSFQSASIALRGVERRVKEANYDYNFLFNVVFKDVPEEIENSKEINRFNQELRRNNPYKRKNIPEFKQLFEDWLIEKQNTI